MMLSYIALAVVYHLATGCAAGAAASSSCSREFLRNATRKYVDAQRAGQASVLVASLVGSGGSSNLTYWENNKALDPVGKNSTLSRAMQIDFDRSAHDTVRCATFTELIAASDSSRPYVVHTRMVFAGGEDGGQAGAAPPKASLIESIVTTTGDWGFDAKNYLAINALEVWTSIPKDQQDARAVVQAAGDAYFDRFASANVSVPWGPPCYRLEGGEVAHGTLAGDDCVMVWPRPIHVPYRRYVVDEELGLVDLFIGFPGLDRSQGRDPMPDSHVFRVEKGRIKYIHTASACIEAGCGLGGKSVITV